MTDFVELSKPKQEAGGWYVATNTPCSYMRWLVNDSSNTLGDTDYTTGSAHLYYESEWAAQSAAAKYYRSHGETYPYHDACKLADFKLVSISLVVVDVESEVMEFE